MVHQLIQKLVIMDTRSCRSALYRITALNNFHIADQPRVDTRRVQVSRARKFCPQQEWQIPYHADIWLRFHVSFVIGFYARILILLHVFVVLFS